jgi:hypothetical protein
MLYKTLIGSDPELFLEDAQGKIISAIGKIGGTKKKPRPVKELGRGFAVQEDNVLVEYNTPPVGGPESWVESHKIMRDYLTNLVGQLGLKLSKKASHSMDEDQMNHPRAWIFGCDPDFDVWKLEMNPKPAAKDKFLRSAGGHIHIGYSKASPATSIPLVRALDYYVGAWLAMLDPDTKRRELYGKAGACRFKTYGVEYRTPSNFWLSDPALTNEVFERTKMATRHFETIRPELAKQAADFINGDTAKTDWYDNQQEKKKVSRQTFDGPIPAEFLELLLNAQNN